MKVHLTCDYCGKEFWRDPSLAKRAVRHFCDRACSHAKQVEERLEQRAKWRTYRQDR